MISNALLTAAGSTINFCSQTASIWQLVGRILFVFKIVIPLLLIIFGMMDLGKAVVGKADDEIKKATKALAMRAIAGVIIFFVPVLVGFIFSLVDDFSDVENDYAICKTCIVHPKECNTKKSK